MQKYVKSTTYLQESYCPVHDLSKNLLTFAFYMKGIPAELLIFPDENHWVLKPQNGILWQRTFFNWLDRWLKK